MGKNTHYREVGRLDVIFQSGALHLEDMEGQTVFYIWGFPKLGVPKNRGFLMENIIQIWGKQHSLWLQQL
jgi:hypothetical protein